ncbi:hypothetical protein TWF694_004248 [Orbilia ellipsospora]|uniref:Thioredoxin domain-containing protein n=1 Tax=Orbilia ellipsospora TaxID=2528407 RepID=A0AAV9WXF8_9PEZI
MRWSSLLLFSFSPRILHFASASPAPASAPEVAPDGDTSILDPNVPFLRDLTPDNFDKTTKNGYWFVKHFSPYCRHCVVAAPVWQTLYEFYLKSSPASASSPHPNSPPSFTETYDWHFANVDCAAHGDLCNDHGVSAYPMFGLFKDGKKIDQFKGSKNTIELLSEFMEKHLEEIKPGSRPASIDLPTPPTLEQYNKIMAARKSTPTSETATKKLPLPTPETKAPVKEKPAAPARKGPLPNPKGKSVNLNMADFQSKVLDGSDGWLVKFFAPWCSHCQAMAPAWHSLGIEMEGTLNIGEVNCEIERRLCKDVKVAAYPTILFFQSGERIEYKGLRGLGDLVSWARQAANAGIKEIGDAADFEVIQQKHEVIFLYFYDHATVSEDFDALSRVTMPLIGHAPLYKTNSDHLARKYRITTWPQLVVLRDDRPSYYPALSPADIRDTTKIVEWMRTVWLPTVPELSATNSHEIMNGKTVVLGILDSSKEEKFKAAKLELKEAANIWIGDKQRDEKVERQELRDRKQHKIDEAEDRGDERALKNAKGMPIILPKRKEVGFAWVDGIFWERWLKQTYNIDVKEMGNRVIINEEDEKLYWDENANGDPILPSRTAILDVIKDVVKNPHKMKAKSTVGQIERAFMKAKDSSTSHPILTFLTIIAVLAVAYYVRKGKGKKSYTHHAGLTLNPGKESGWGQGWFGGEKDGYFGGSGGGGGKYD